jgi:hypothetical protein
MAPTEPALDRFSISRPALVVQSGRHRINYHLGTVSKHAAFRITALAENPLYNHLDRDVRQW